ncbi:twisted gastrulation protein homolog 1-A-like [Lytechinus pictus]|uniref:twisted gastrulation protein homolog 1-A-like n=1 Tax=Lytechinus pictus TaxID=7653 RepID=UPI00240D073E|nr:twisted gastrulation protein homolog 1-A-like [Lytechinus pictus]
MKTTVFIAVMVAGIAYAVGVTVLYERCNENKCVSRVSKCQLTGACGCTLDNCTCCVNCTLCLAELWDDCCSCVNMCKPRNMSATDMASYSTIHDLRVDSDMADILFNALTEHDKPHPDAHWTVERVTPQEEGVILPGLAGPDNSESRDNAPVESSPSTKPATSTAASANETIVPMGTCTVAYINICLGLKKCEDACEHMGAAKYRWFHTGCCECVGSTCLSYGKKKALCRDCPND